MSEIIARAGGIPAARICREKEMLELQQGQWGKEGLGMAEPGEKIPWSSRERAETCLLRALGNGP